MREIKFRGKIAFGGYDGGNGWIYGNLTGSPTHPYIQEVKDKGNDWYHLPRTEVTPRSIGQFTGLHDKNGKEIYEGDIIRSFDSKGEPIIHFIQYDNEEAGFVAILKGSAKGDFGYGRCYQQWITECEKEVIGNIHDNLELLK